MLKPSQAAFTLIELSIVLVIIGLIITAILYGRDLISNAETREIINRFYRYETALNAFRAKYNYYPGDFPNATLYWGTFSGGCPDGGGAGTETCNGNGNGLIDNSVVNNARETLAFWKHLANAGFVEGNYTGAASTAGTDNASAGNNVPRGNASGSAYAIRYMNSPTGSAQNFPVVGHRLVYGQNQPDNVLPQLPILSPENAYLIDRKMDDGLPGKGKVLTWKPTLPTLPNCATTSNEATAAYNITYGGPACAIFYVIF